MNGPRVLIVVPSWQQGRFLSQCLDSLLAQTYPWLEVVVSDNVSTDETPAVLERYAQRLTAVVRERDLGQTAALRQAFTANRADVLSWLNADDMLMPDAVERAVDALSGPSQPDLVYGNCAFLDVAGQFLGYGESVDPFSRWELLNYSDFIPQPSAFFRRSAYEALGGLDPRLAYAMDWDLWCRMARRGCVFAPVDSVLSGVRLHPESKTSRGGYRRIAELTRLNVRHSPLRIPLLAASQLYSAKVPKGLKQGTPALRWLWQRLPGRRPHADVVHGLGQGGLVVQAAPRIRFPVHQCLQRARAQLDGARAEAPSLRASLNATRATDTTATQGTATAHWEFGRPTHFTHVDLSVQLDESNGLGSRLRFEWA